jgi:hypothetical protein
MIEARSLSLSLCARGRRRHAWRRAFCTRRRVGLRRRRAMVLLIMKAFYMCTSLCLCARAPSPPPHRTKETLGMCNLSLCARAAAAKTQNTHHTPGVCV